MPRSDPEYFHEIQIRLDRIDHWEERHRRRVERDRRDKIIVNSKGEALVTYHFEDENDKLYRLHNQAMKINLLWWSSYAYMVEEGLFVVDYLHIVIDQRLGLRKTLSWRDTKHLDRVTRFQIRDQIDGIIAALKEIEEFTAYDV